jgi:hypothetical protein
MSRRVPRSRPVDTATRRAVMARDAGLHRIAAVTRWTAAAVVALSGGLALVAAKAFHGHTATTAPVSSTRTPETTAPATSTPATTTTTTTTTPATTTPSTTTPAIQQPAQAPAPVQQVPVVVSGGS